MSNYQQPQASWEWMQFENEMRLAACIGQEGESEARHLALVDKACQRSSNIIYADLCYMIQVDEHLLQAQAKPARVLRVRKTTERRV